MGEETPSTTTFFFSKNTLSLGENDRDLWRPSMVSIVPEDKHVEPFKEVAFNSAGSQMWRVTEKPLDTEPPWDLTTTVFRKKTTEFPRCGGGTSFTNSSVGSRAHDSIQDA